MSTPTMLRLPVNFFQQNNVFPDKKKTKQIPVTPWTYPEYNVESK